MESFPFGHLFISLLPLHFFNFMFFFLPRQPVFILLSSTQLLKSFLLSLYFLPVCPVKGGDCEWLNKWRVSEWVSFACTTKSFELCSSHGFICMAPKIKIEIVWEVPGASTKESETDKLAGSSGVDSCTSWLFFGVVAVWMNGWLTGSLNEWVSVS